MRASQVRARIGRRLLRTVAADPGRPPLAIATLSPTPSEAGSDTVSLREASELFAQTGHPVTPRTLKRWCDRHEVTVLQHGRDNWASWSDLLEIHAEEVDAREAR
ncbi:hypothetical protein ACFZAR_36365 [Streptomyces sp. NPDC008222]|uniref:hypothetical protein n=1 Tax=Streptomyces sp. NPDC008222 TaxID=3364820 RepID=UPI0036E6898B